MESCTRNLSCEFHADFVAAMGKRLSSSVWNCRLDLELWPFLWMQNNIFADSITFQSILNILLCPCSIIPSVPHSNRLRSAQTARFAVSANNRFVCSAQSRVIYQLRKHEKGKNVSEGTAKAEFWYHQRKIKTKHLIQQQVECAAVYPWNRSYVNESFRLNLRRLMDSACHLILSPSCS